MISLREEKSERENLKKQSSSVHLIKLIMQSTTKVRKDSREQKPGVNAQSPKSHLEYLRLHVYQ